MTTPGLFFLRDFSQWNWGMAPLRLHLRGPPEHGSYLLLFQVPPPKKLWQGPMLPVLAPRTKRTTLHKQTHTNTHTHTQRRIICNRIKTCLTTFVPRAPSKINRGHFGTPRSPLGPPHPPSLQTPTETVSGPHVDEEELRPNSSGRKEKKRLHQLAAVHLPHNTSKGREHTYAVCWTLVQHNREVEETCSYGNTPLRV